MPRTLIVVKAASDPEARVWYVEHSDLHGVNAEDARRSGSASFRTLFAEQPKRIVINPCPEPLPYTQSAPLPQFLLHCIGCEALVDMKAEAVNHPLHDLFANYKREIYDKNPLIEVILQVRFPTLLRLQSELPSEFQGKIIGQYPHYETHEALEVKVRRPNAPPSLSQTKVHGFLSAADKHWRITLSSDSISLSTKQYKHWEAFKERAEFCLKTFFTTYPIKVITRIGLRYRNLIRPSKIAKTDKEEWSVLINPRILGPMGAKEFRSIALEASRWSQQFAIGDVRVILQGGIVKQEGETCYALDYDVFLPKEIIAETGAPQSDLDRLHELVGPLFRWAITDELHAALGPEPA